MHTLPTNHCICVRNMYGRPRAQEVDYTDVHASGGGDVSRCSFRFESDEVVWRSVPVCDGAGSSGAKSARFSLCLVQRFSASS